MPERSQVVQRDQVIEALRPVEDPELGRSIVELDMVRDLIIEGADVAVLVALTVPGCPLKAEITARVSEAVKALDGVDRVNVEFTVMTDEQRAKVRELMGGTPPPTAPGESTTGSPMPFAEASSSTRVIGLSSGKGGVGKSSVTVNLAVALARAGHDVAVLDADVYGFSVPRMMGVDRPPVVIDDMIVPPVAHGVKVISTGFFVPDDQPVIWRGPMLHKALEQFLTDVMWGEPDYLLVDMPPGTGDVALSVAQFVPRAEMVVITTPQPAAQRVAQRSALMARKVNLAVLGVVENMSWFTGDDGRRYEIFGSGGGQLLAEDLNVALLGRLPLVTALREGGDVGVPVTVADPGSEASRAFEELAATVAATRPSRRYLSELKVT